MRVPTYRDHAVVLRTHQLGEADRIITLLTRSNGKIRAVAKGVRRATSKFGSRVEPFNHIDVQLAMGRGSLEVVTQVDTLHPSRLGEDYRAFTAAEVLVETADRLVVEEHTPSLQQYRLLLGALLALQSGRLEASLVVNSYLVRALAIAGYAVASTECAGCGSYDVRWFSPQGGGGVCPSCRTSGSVQLGSAEREHLGALLAGEWPVATKAEPAVASRVDGMVVAYATWHLDRALRSLPYFER